MDQTSATKLFAGISRVWRQRTETATTGSGELTGDTTPSVFEFRGDFEMPTHSTFKKRDRETRKQAKREEKLRRRQERQIVREALQ